MNSDSEEYIERENMWDEAWPTTERESGDHAVSELDVTDELSPFPDAVGTSDPLEATRDAEPYIPPIDPPVLPSNHEGIQVATGFGISAEEEAARDGEPRRDDDLEAQARTALTQDSLASQFDLNVHAHEGVLRLTGIIPSVQEAEHVTWLLGELPGVVDVLDDTTLEPTLP